MTRSSLKIKKKRFSSGKEFADALRSRQQQAAIPQGAEETIVVTKDEIKEIEKKYHPKRKTKMMIALAAGIIVFSGLGYLLYNFGLLNFLYGNASTNWNSLSELEKKRVELLLEEGDLLMTRNNLVLPQGKNAVERYSEALKIHSANQHANAKLNQISSTLEKEINTLIKNRDTVKAKELIAAGTRYFPKNITFQRASGRIQAGQLEANAKILIDKDPWEAYRISKKIEKLDPGNKFIATALPSIKSNLIKNADKNFDKRNYKAALDEYNKVIEFFGKDNSVEQKISNTTSAYKKSNLLYMADNEFKKKNYQEAIAHYNNYLKLYGSDSYVKQRLAAANSEMQKSSKITVPNLIGSSLNDAENILAKNGLVKGKVSEIVSVQNKGKVINQIPKSGSTAQKGTEVRLFIGK